MGFVAWAGSAVKTNNAINILRKPHQKMPLILDLILDDGPVLSDTLANPPVVRSSLIGGQGPMSCAYSGRMDSMMRSGWEM
jgi:hypothetical protein